MSHGCCSNSIIRYYIALLYVGILYEYINRINHLIHFTYDGLFTIAESVVSPKNALTGINVGRYIFVNGAYQSTRNAPYQIWNLQKFFMRSHQPSVRLYDYNVT